jgi:hypothetical protein
MVGQAARVQISVGPAVSVDPDKAKTPLQLLQSARAVTRPSANVTL